MRRLRMKGPFTRLPWSEKKCGSSKNHAADHKCVIVEFSIQRLFLICFEIRA